MKQQIGVVIIGHVDHSKTALAAAVIVALNQCKQEAETMQEIIVQNTSIKITAPPEIPLIEWNFKSGKQSRRERRSKERKTNKRAN